MHLHSGTTGVSAALRWKWQTASIELHFLLGAVLPPIFGQSAEDSNGQILQGGFKPYNPDKLNRREEVDNQLNSIALNMIQQDVGTKDLAYVRNFTTAKEAWDGLSVIFMRSESVKRNKYSALRNQAEGFMRLLDENHHEMYRRLITIADAFQNVGAQHIDDFWIKDKYIDCMMPYEPIDVKSLLGRESYSKLTSYQVVHEMQALKVAEQNSQDSRNCAIGMARGTNLALKVNTVEEVDTQEPYRISWSMSYPEDLEYHYHDHMAFHARTFWVDPSKAKKENIKRNNASGFKSSGPRSRSCFNCGDKFHFIAECPYENRETRGGRLIPKDKSKDSKAPNKKLYIKNKKTKSPSRIVLMTEEEYSSNDNDSDSDEEETSKEVAIATTNIPSSSLFESPNENPHIKNAHSLMARSSLDTSIVLSTQEEYTSGDDDDDDEEEEEEDDETYNGLVALASLSTTSSSPIESPNEDIHMKEENCFMAKTSDVSSPNPSMPNIANDLGVDHASLKIKQEMLEFDEFMLNLKGDKKHVGALMCRLAQLDDILDKKCQIEREDSLEIASLKIALEEEQETRASLEEKLETLEEPQDEIAKLTKERDLARAKVKVLSGVDHEKLVKDLDDLDKAHKALKSEHSLLSKFNEQLQIRIAKYDVPSSSTSTCDHANIVEENARLKDELAKASSSQSKLSLDDLLSKQRSNNGKEGIGYNAKEKKANKKMTKPTQEQKKVVINALEDPDWLDAMHDELNNFKRNKVWTLVEKPKECRNVIGTKWIFKNKQDEHGIVVRNKARLVAQGFSQIEGIDFGETYALVAHLESICILLAYASHHNFKFQQIYVKSSFLNGPFHEEVFVKQPLGFEDPDFPNHVYKLDKALYGLKQAPRAWYEHLKELLLDRGFDVGLIDPTLFTKRVNGELFVCQLYVDDIIFGSTNKAFNDEFSKLMTDRFEMSMMGEMRFFLGFEIKQLREGTFISQAKYLQDMLKRFKMKEMKGVASPIVTKCHLVLDPNGKEVDQKFFATVYVGTDDTKTMTWMTDGKQLSGTWAQFAHCLGYPVIPPNAANVFRAHYTKKPIDKALLADLYLPGEVVLGSSKYLIPVYDILLRIYHEVLNPKAPIYAPYIMRFIAAHWEAMEFGDLMEVCHSSQHKAKDLKVKAHPMPPSAPTSAHQDVEASFPPNADKGWMARVDAKITRMFCLKVDINQRQYQAHMARKMDKRDTKLIMRKLNIPVEDGSEASSTPEEELLSKHGNVTEFEKLGMPGPSRQHVDSDAEMSDPEPAKSDDDDEEPTSDDTEESDED
ncbi:hypothetical protein QYE76_011958 [Lolium multiflorum]|uniref:CCHC-type domain-containing protein n=1 Tax=Lolium multiflorum TaxID=4521 RepID=A0AAD8TXY0_LOLMU|nr:hypothetical protein QYE76_011958 [Lolium multiflorum]